VGSPEARFSDSDSFFFFKSESKSRMGEGRPMCRVAVWGRR